MARPKGSRKAVPDYLHHKGSGQAYVLLDGQFVYLGKYGTAASRREYDRVIAAWLAAGRRWAGDAGATVAEVVAAFWQHTKAFYRKPIVGPDGNPQIGDDGKPLTAPTGEADNYRLALRPLLRLYADQPVKDIGPEQLISVRADALKPRTVIDRRTKKEKRLPGWSRSHANRQVKRIVECFRWAAEKGMVPGDVVAGLKAVKAIPKGRGLARESAPVRPVPDAHVDAIKDHVGRQVWAMIELQRLTGMRSGEVCVMRSRDVDTTGSVWQYRPAQHKTLHLDHDRVIDIGPAAQRILSPFLKTDLSAYVFSPAEAEAERRVKATAARRTPATQGNRPGTNVKARPRRRPQARYTPKAYRQAVVRACARAEVPAWHPHQLRHSFGTAVRKRYGFEASQIALGTDQPARRRSMRSGTRACRPGWPERWGRTARRGGKISVRIGIGPAGGVHCLFLCLFLLFAR